MLSESMNDANSPCGIGRCDSSVIKANLFLLCIQIGFGDSIEFIFSLTDEFLVHQEKLQRGMSQLIKLILQIVKYESNWLFYLLYLLDLRNAKCFIFNTNSIQLYLALLRPTSSSQTMEKRLTAQLIKRIVPIFEFNNYKNAENKVQYIHDLIEVNLYKRKINRPLLSMNELCDILNQIKIPLKNKQIHQLYLYATYQRFDKIQETKQKLIAMINQEKHKIDTKNVAEWLQQKISNGDIKIAVSSNQKKPNKSQSEHIPLKTKKFAEKLPPLRGPSSQKLQQELKFLIEIFQQMEAERQSSGLIPMNQNQDDQLQIPSSSIPYDPDLYVLNNNLSKLRIKAQDRLARIIEFAKTDKRIRFKLEEAIEKFQKQRIEANEKVGRIGAMKAYKRLADKKKEDISKIRNLKLGEQEDIVRASHLHALLNLPEIKTAKIIY